MNTMSRLLPFALSELPPNMHQLCGELQEGAEQLPEEPEGWNWWSTKGSMMLIQMPTGTGCYFTLDFRQAGIVRLWVHMMDNPKAINHLDIPLAE